MSFFDNRPMVEPIPEKPIIFLAQMPEWTNKIGCKNMIKKNQLIHSRKQVSLGDRIIKVILSIIGGSFSVYVNIIMIFKIENFWQIIGTVLFFICFVFPFIAHIINIIQDPDRLFIFDRLKGTLTMPENWFMWNNKTVTIPLEQVQYFVRPVVGPFGGATIKVVFPKYRNPSYFNKMTFGTHGMLEVIQTSNWLIRSELSVINWFMDKNRPLPPGILFDPYREEDYLRRKAEGFPAPKYESYVDTPEWEGAITKYGDKQAKNRNQTIYKGSGKPGVPYGAL